MQRIREAVEACKHELSVSEEATINLPFLAVDKKGPKHLTEKIQRKQFEEMVLDLIKKLEEPCNIAIKDAGCSLSDLTEIVLVGGMTRVPIVRRKVIEIFGKAPLIKINPDEVVAVGAAIQGNILKGTFDDLLLIDITPLSLGVETQGGIFTRLIEKNSPIPIKKSEMFSTTRDNQEMVEIHVLQGEREMAAGNKSLGKFRLTGIPKSPRGQPKIEVSFEIDTNGIVHVSARDKDTRKEHKIQVSGLTGLTKEELERITEESKMHKDSDVSRKQLQEAKNQLETSLYVIEKFETEFTNQLSDKDKKDIGALIVRSRRLMNEGTDVEAILKTSEEIEKTVTKATEVVYDSLSKG
jgi:molecular chaperone DnaK